ncbi:MAG: hypothetical protein JWN66_4082 [Sphingomonas bacterium]|uniref:hypothetical protein n=1 Tax=Sphingomonas bacterium TaxID=1895847 RepID=UPI00260E7BBB|nr:hypothetical protein [Sphingomonas bacterium]MDB5706966.1 hypothetical protein [Sphingomonas bacterium]
MRKFDISHAGRDGAEPFAPYLFDVSSDGRKVAQLGHDYRGDEHWMRLPGSDWVELPERVLKGGGPGGPLYLSPEGIKAIQRLISE